MDTVEITDSDKHSSLLQYRINSGRIKLYDTGPKGREGRHLDFGNYGSPRKKT